MVPSSVESETTSRWLNSAPTMLPGAFERLAAEVVGKFFSRLAKASTLLDY